MKASENISTEEKFEEALDNLCDTLIEQVKPFYQSELQPFNSFAGFLREQLKKQITSFRNSFINGYQPILENIVVHKSEKEKEKYIIPKDIWQNLEKSQQKLTGNENLQVLLGYTGEMMAEMYSLAIKLLKEKQYEKSADIFIFLGTLNPYAGWFWQGLGNARQAQERYDEALYAYGIALNCIPYEIEGYRDAARCCLKQKNYEGAINVLNYGLDIVHVSQVTEQLQQLENGLQAMIAYIESLKEGG